MAKLQIEAVVATSRPLAAYGGVRIDDRVLDQIADALESGRIPMFVQHDLRRPLDAEVVASGVRATPDGHKDVWIEFEVDAAQWDGSIASVSPPGRRAGSPSRAPSRSR